MQIYKFSTVLFAVLVGAFIMLSLESMGVTHFLFPRSTLKQTAAVEKVVQENVLFVAFDNF